MLNATQLCGFGVGISAVQYGNFDGVAVFYDHNHSDVVRATVAYSSDNNNWTGVATLGDWSSGALATCSQTWTAPGRKRYWRLRFYDPDGNMGSQSDAIMEVTWRQDGSDVTDKTGVTLSSSGIGGTIANTYDGNTSTGTTSSSEGATLTFDFGA